MSQRRTPLTPLFDRNKTTGSIEVGATPPTAAPRELAFVGSVAVADIDHIDVSGDTCIAVIASSGGSIVGIDVPIGSAPSVLGTTSVTEVSDGLDAVIVGDNVFVPTTGGAFERLEAVDVTDPASPSHLGGLDSPEIGPSDAAGDYLYSASYAGEQFLYSFDISTASAPTLEDTLSETDLDFIISLALNNTDSSMVVAGTSVDRLCVVDVSDPAALALDGSVQDSNTPRSGFNAVAASGDVAVAIDTVQSRMVVFDISTPASPAQVATLTDGNMIRPTVIAMVGSVVMVSAFDDGYLHAVDVSTPASPAIVDSLYDVAYEEAVDIKFDGDKVVLATLDAVKTFSYL